MGSIKNCILSVCLVLAAFVIAEINGQGSLSAEHGVNKLAASLFKPVVEQSSGNILVSPTGVAIGLAMLAYGSDGNTKAQFRRLLDLPSSYRAGLNSYQSLIEDLKGVQKNELKFGSKLFVSQQSPVKNAYKKMLKDYLDTEVEAVNFNNAEEAANIINTWTQNVGTDHPKHIPPMVEPGSLGSKTKMVLAIPMYFKGKWLNGFNANNTRPRPFKLNKDVTKDVPTMVKTSMLKYGEMPSGKGTYVVMPLQGNELSMVIFLPKSVNGLAELEKELPKASVASYINAAKDRMVHVHLPKLMFHNKINLKKPLMSLGLTDAFNHKANFSGISNQKLEISKFIQNTHFEVDEEGGDIDAGTANIASRIAVSPVNFIAEHPFHISVVRNLNSGSDKTNVITLYSGHVVDPSS